MVDQETPFQAGLNDVVDIGSCPWVVQNMNDGKDDRSRTFEFFMKISSLHNSNLNSFTCFCDTENSAALCKISTARTASDLLKWGVGLYRTVKLFMVDCK